MENSKAIEIFNKWMDCKDAYQADPPCDGNCLSCEYYASAEGEKEAMLLAIAALEQREKAFDEWCTDCKEYDKERHCCHRFTKVIRQAVEEHRREWPDSKWIPVTENPKKPKYQFDTYLVYTKYERFGVADYFGGGGWNGYDVDGDQLDELEIVAWMPLPEPYKEDKA